MQQPAATVRCGLTESEAQQRLAVEGFNDLPATNRRTFLHIVVGVLREPMFALLLGAGGMLIYAAPVLAEMRAICDAVPAITAAAAARLAAAMAWPGAGDATPTAQWADARDQLLAAVA